MQLSKSSLRFQAYQCFKMYLSYFLKLQNTKEFSLCLMQFSTYFGDAAWACHFTSEGHYRRCLTMNVEKVFRSAIQQDTSEWLILFALKSFWRIIYKFNPFFPMHPFSTPWKHQKTLRWINDTGTTESGKVSRNFLLGITAWKVSVFEVILVLIFPHLDWIRRDTPCLSIFSSNAGKYGPEKLRIRTVFM